MTGSNEISSDQTGVAGPKASEAQSESEPVVQFTIVHNRSKFPLSFASSATVLDVKQQLETLTKVPVAMQKLIYRGMLADAIELTELELPKKGAKIMLIGTSQSEVDQMRQSSSVDGDGAHAASTVMSQQPESWCDQPEHKKVLEKHGKPDNAMVGILNTEDILAPDEPLTGLYDKRGQALRLRVRSDTPELWLATYHITHKISLATINEVVSQPIKSHPEYHIMAFQLGPTAKSRFFVYWVPSQYVESVKTLVLQHKLLSNLL